MKQLVIWKGDLLHVHSSYTNQEESCLTVPSNYILKWRMGTAHQAWYKNRKIVKRTSKQSLNYWQLRFSSKGNFWKQCMLKLFPDSLNNDCIQWLLQKDCEYGLYQTVMYRNHFNFLKDLWVLIQTLQGSWSSEDSSSLIFQPNMSFELSEVCGSSIINIAKALFDAFLSSCSRAPYFSVHDSKVR